MWKQKQFQFDFLFEKLFEFKNNLCLTQYRKSYCSYWHCTHGKTSITWARFFLCSHEIDGHLIRALHSLMCSSVYPNCMKLITVIKNIWRHGLIKCRQKNSFGEGVGTRFRALWEARAGRVSAAARHAARPLRTDLRTTCSGSMDPLDNPHPTYAPK